MSDSSDFRQSSEPSSDPVEPSETGRAMSSSGPGQDRARLSPEAADASSVYSSPGHDAPVYPYCHLAVIPLIVGPPSEPSFPLQICIHPEFTLVDNAVLHLVRDAAHISTNPSIHARPYTRTQLRPLDMYTPYMASLDLSGTPSPPNTPLSPVRPPPRSPSRSPPRLSSPSYSDSGLRPLDTNPLPVEDGGRPPDVRHPPQDWRPPSPPHLALIISAIVALVSLFLTFSPGHLAWVMTSSANSTIDIPLWQPIHLLYRDYEESILPLLTRFELPNPILPGRPTHILTGLREELQEIGMGLGTWKGTGLPPLDPDMLNEIRQVNAQFILLDKSFRSLYRSGDTLLRAFPAELLSFTIVASDSRAEIFRHITNFWFGVEEANLKALKSLWEIDKSLKTIELELVLDYLDNNFKPLLVHPNRGYRREAWVVNTIDAIAMTRLNILPLIDSIGLLVSRAIATLSTADSNIAGQLKTWELAELNGGVWQQDVCRFTTDSPRWWSSWLYKYTRETMVWEGVNNRTVKELIKVAQRGSQVADLVVEGMKGDCGYSERRPSRPMAYY
ncbi:hypothetical protein Neosp_015264 [[Neocosmospora] mangrovei]